MDGLIGLHLDAYDINLKEIKFRLYMNQNQQKRPLNYRIQFVTVTELNLFDVKRHSRVACDEDHEGLRPVLEQWSLMQMFCGIWVAVGDQFLSRLNVLTGL